MGTSPTVVLATTSTDPLSSNSISWVSATAARNVAKNALFKDRIGCFEKEMSRSTTFPVDTPPTVLERGSLSYTKHPHQSMAMTRIEKHTSAASWPSSPRIMSSAACTTCRANPNGFL